MTTETLAGVDVKLNDEGFFLDPDQWCEDDGRGARPQGGD